ncbi:MAG: hypothetical protein ACK4G3_00050 [bacterium]
MPSAPVNIRKIFSEGFSCGWRNLLPLFFLALLWNAPLFFFFFVFLQFNTRKPQFFQVEVDFRKIGFLVFLVSVFLLFFFLWSAFIQAGLFSSVQMAFQGKRVEALESLTQALPLFGNFLWTYIVLMVLVILLSFFVVISLVFPVLLLSDGKEHALANFVAILIFFFLLLVLYILAFLFLVVPPLEFLFPVIVAENRGGLSALLRAYQITFRSFSGGYLPALALSFFWFLVGLVWAVLDFFANFFIGTPAFLIYHIFNFFLLFPLFTLFRAALRYALYKACAGEEMMPDDKIIEVINI